MATTQTTRLGIYRWSGDADSFTRSQMDTSHENIELRSGGFYAGATAPTPAAQYERSLFLNTSTGKLFFFSGTDSSGSWVALNDFIDNITRNISIGSGTATTVNNVAITAPAATATLSLASGSTFATTGAHTVTLNATASTSITLPLGGTLSTLTGTETLTNKSLSDTTSHVISATDSSRRIRFSASSIATATTRTFTFPNVSGTIITSADTGTVNNTMISAVDYTKVTNLQTWGDGRYYTETEVANAYVYQWGNRANPSTTVLTNARQIYVQASAPATAQDGDLWFDL